MANFTNYQESKAAMLLVETQQRGIGTKPAATNDGDTSVGEPPSPLLNIGGVGASGARFHQHLPPSSHHHYPQTSLPKEQQHPLSHHYQAATEHHLSVENITESPVRKASSSSLNLVQQDPAASHHALAASVNAASAAIQLAANANVSVATSEGVVDDIQKCGYLRKQKHGHKRFFVLRAASHLGLSRLEYYDSEKKFRNSLRSAAAAAANGTVAASPPKRVIYLYQCFTVNKRADSKNKHLIALYTKDEYFAIVAENEQEQDDWYVALSELMSEGKRGHLDSDELDDGYGTVTPGTVFKEVWQVNVKPKGLGQTKNLTGVYRLCLSTKTIHLVKLNSETPCVNLQLMNIRRCGHSESFFFMEVGRSSSIGPGEIWMQVDDSVVAQNMHETILETMKALKAFAEIRPRSKSQSSGSNPIAFITTRRHLGNLPPSQTGLQRRSRTESVVGTPPSSKSSGASGYRFRTSSEGEGTMNRPFRSVTGSLIHLNTARIHLGRQEGGVGAGNTGSTGVVGRYARAIPGSTYHARSASLPVSHFPSTTSPVSVSSSSGHGSVSGTLTRPSSASICGSPSDGGFNSSDEYGSSPGDFRYFRVRSNTPDSLGNTPPIREENCMSDYMAMGWHREVFGAASGGGSSSGSAETPNRDESTSTDDDRSLRRRAHSFTRPGGQGVVAGGSSGVTVYQKMTQTTFSLDESVSVGEALSLVRTDSITQPSSSSSSLRSDYSSCSEHSQGRPPLSAKEDSGYMPMLCGVAASPCDAPDYMPMQPSSPSLHHHQPQPSHSPQAPRSVQQPTDHRGYMMMLPGGRSSSSPVQASPSPHSSSSNMGLGGGSVSSSGSIVERPENGEYMDMSYSSSGGVGGDAAGGRKFCNEGGYYALSNPEGRDPKSYSYSPYFSLPRSYKAPAAREREQREREQREREQREREQREREQRAHDDYVPMSSPAKPVYSQVATGNVAERGVTTRGVGSGGSDTPHILPHAYPPPPYGVHHQAANGDRRTIPVRPNRLPLGRRSFHGSLRVSEPDAVEVLSSPGEYINIEFGGRYGPPTSCPLSAQDGSPSVGSAEQRRSPPHPQNQDYMSVEVGGGGDDGGRLAKNKSPRPSLVAPWNPPSYIRPLAAGASVSGAPDSSGARWRTGTDDYTDMTFNLSRGEESRGLRSSPTAMLQHLCLMESCYPPTLTSASPPSSSPQPEPIKVVRADPQGRRRHSSETFSSSSTSGGGGAPSSNPNPSLGSANPSLGSANPSLGSANPSLGSANPSSGSALNVAHLAESSKWTGSGSFDSVWMCVEGVGGDSAVLPARPGPSDLGMASASSVCPPGGRMCRNMSVGYQNGLNYIALELREDRDSNPLPVPQQQQGGTGHGTGATPNAPQASNLTVPVAEDNGAYGSIDFIKSDGMTATSKD